MVEREKRADNTRTLEQPGKDEKVKNSRRSTTISQGNAEVQEWTKTSAVHEIPQFPIVYRIYIFCNNDTCSDICRSHENILSNKVTTETPREITEMITGIHHL